MKTLESLRIYLEINQEALAEAENQRERDYYRERCYEVSAEIEEMEGDAE